MFLPRIHASLPFKFLQLPIHILVVATIVIISKKLSSCHQNSLVVAVLCYWLLLCISSLFYSNPEYSFFFYPSFWNDCFLDICMADCFTLFWFLFQCYLPRNCHPWLPNLKISSLGTYCTPSVVLL
jgi:hypothetical protein